MPPRNKRGTNTLRTQISPAQDGSVSIERRGFGEHLHGSATFGPPRIPWAALKMAGVHHTPERTGARSDGLSQVRDAPKSEVLSGDP